MGWGSGRSVYHGSSIEWRGVRRSPVWEHGRAADVPERVSRGWRCVWRCAMRTAGRFSGPGFVAGKLPNEGRDELVVAEAGPHLEQYEFDVPSGQRFAVPVTGNSGECAEPDLRAKCRESHVRPADPRLGRGGAAYDSFSQQPFQRGAFPIRAARVALRI